MNHTGSGKLSIILKYLRHRLASRYRNGYGVHSPYLYALVRNVIFNRADIQVPEEVLLSHRKLRRDPVAIEVDDRGAGSLTTRGARRTIGSMVKHSSVTEKQGTLLYRLCSWYQPATVLEFGTGLGISTSYLASGSGNAEIITIEGSPEKHKYAVHNFPGGISKKVDFRSGTFADHFEVMLNRAGERTIVFIDGDHRYQSTMDKVRAFLHRDLENIMVILDDIYWSDEMERAWKACFADPKVDISLDLFHFGILIRKPGIVKQHLKIKF
ncbi:MAG: class I SAM-dependent methyltransferase [Bacteroidales bacterium]